MRKDKYYIELTEEDIKKNHDEIISLLRSTEREGVEKLIEYLDENNYFTYAASKSRHDSFYGGLAHHSLMDYREAMRIYENEKNGVAKDVDPIILIYSRKYTKSFVNNFFWNIILGLVLVNKLFILQAIKRILI